MNRIPVSSSNIVSIGYDEDEFILEIEFKSYTVYQYMDVPENVFASLVSAGSKGKYFHTFIRGRYPTKRIR